MNENANGRVNGSPNGKLNGNPNEKVNGNPNGKVNGSPNGKYKTNGITYNSREVNVPVPVGYQLLGFISHLISNVWSIISFGWTKKAPADLEIMGVKVGPTTWVKKEGSGLPRGYQLLEELKKFNVKTMDNVPNFLMQKYGDSPLCGTRKLIQRDILEEDSKPIEKLHLGEYEWKSSGQIQHSCDQVASAFNKMGLKRGDRIAIFSETKEDWFVSAIGAFRNGLTIVTLYTNLIDSGLIHCLNETEVYTIIVSYDTLPRLISILGNCHYIKNVIVIEDQLNGIGDITKIPQNISVIPFSHLKREVELNENNRSTEDDLAIIMYTSGSSGNPKGVEISHKNIFCSLAFYLLQANTGIGDIYLAYLPLAHIMELTSELAHMILGVKIAYGSPFTLTNSSPKIAAGSVGDTVMVRPTAMNVVALILDRIMTAVSLKVNKASNLRQKLFHMALRTKIENEHSIMSKIFDALVFKKVRAELGGRLKMIVVGGAPLSADTHNRFRALFGCTVQCGYGCTETAATGASMQAYDTRTGTVGPPNYLVSIKLDNWIEGGYLTTDTPYPRGEIIIGGGSTARGYFRNEEETKIAFFNAEGIRWFRTGDIGQFNEAGCLTIIDRKKDLVKLVHGEYISLGSVETCLKANCLVDNICAFADSLQKHPVCVVVPNQEPFLELANDESEHKKQTMEEACSNPVICQIILKELQHYGRKHGLNRWDIPQAIYLHPKPWTPDSGLVTAGFKLRRQNLKNEYRNQIQAMYSKEN